MPKHIGAIASKASRISDGMFMAAAKALAEISLRTTLPDENILPPVSALRNVAFQVARAVGLTAIEEGLAPDVGEAALARRIDGKMWTPAYASYTRSR